MLAGAEAFLATDAGVSVFDFGMAVAEEIDFTQYIFGAGGDALPACDAVTRIEADVCRLMTSAKSVCYAHCFL